ncbi:ABC transporter ATP-binding protein [Chelatococcus asaccharovorans]|uniref:Peptide/nickel transport system ATP-binding protein n=1 Tax=Chelatococcus asaccharovorans TaxID=28210 RepID=A0A2V3U021_9HYPH|nr:ABC transporter ATP-binding protein [Chelatococcus asaccharovorans]MBS7707747.1 ABC transporter ATP-binding protein [Chelatococcus asaccharovorans]PXW55324.1 peptide/nickel transport system ATP-binding protein [Chelatococcus asaccharovorans]
MTAVAKQTPAPAILSVADLAVGFARRDGGTAPAVRGVSFDLHRGEVLALVGESGCGKSATALALIGLLARTARVGGRVDFGGRNLLQLPEREWESIRGRRIAMIFQDPMSSLDPLYRIGDQIAEVLRQHLNLSPAALAARIRELLVLVGIPDPDLRLRQYPHQLSGGQRQRVVIAMALACDPEIIIADEPTTALDVTIQAQIIDLLSQLNRRIGMAMIFISHDLGVVSRIAHRVAVMYAGQLVESGPCERVLQAPAHPYTRGLLASVPAAGMAPKTPLQAIPGMVPDMARLPPGCAFRNRCAQAHDVCQTPPPLETHTPGRAARCWLAAQESRI